MFDNFERTTMIRKILGLLILISAFATVGLADIPAKIEGTWIQDHANVFTAEQRAALDTKVKSIGKNINFAIVTVQSLEGNSVEDYTLNLGRAYGIGAADGEHRGLIYLLAINDHKWRIEVSRHLEGYITDGQAGNIGRSAVPFLKKSDFYGAANSVADQIIAAAANVPVDESNDVKSDQQTTPAPLADDNTGTVLLLIIGGLFVVGLAIFIGVRIKNRIEERAEEARQEELERRRLEAEAERERQRQIREAKAKAEREAHEAWLKTPEGIADTARRKKEAEEAERRRIAAAAAAAAAAAEERRRYEAWAATPEGKAELKRRAEEAERQRKAAEERRKREAEEARRRREREEQEEEERRARRRREESYSSYSSSSSSYSSSDSGSSWSGGFGGSSDFGGGGSSGSW
jgi:uncharacterized membrane protein YgcG